MQWTKNLKSSDNPSQEFCTPSGEWYCTFRSIVYDSWLLWHDALPESLEQRRLLQQDQFDMIKLLGKKLDLFHRSLPDYKQRADSPFTVSCWWDPTHEDEEWNSGRSCLFSIEGYTSEELIGFLPKRKGARLNPLGLKAISTRFVEASVPPLKKEEPTCLIQESLPLSVEEMSVLS